MRLCRFLEVREIDEINEVSVKHDPQQQDSLKGAPFTQIKPKGDITYEEARRIIDSFGRPKQ